MISTDKTINLTQLCVELNRKPIRAIGPDENGIIRVTSEVLTDDELKMAIDSHNANVDYVDPEYVAPEREPTSKELFDVLTEKLISKGALSQAEVNDMKKPRAPKKP